MPSIWSCAAAVAMMAIESAGHRESQCWNGNYHKALAVQNPEHQCGVTTIAANMDASRTRPFHAPSIIVAWLASHCTQVSLRQMSMPGFA